MYILSLVMAFLMDQPLIPVNNKSAPDYCLSHCCKKKEGKKENTGSEDCNPLMICPFCNLFIASRSYPAEMLSFGIKEKILIKNDNRTVKNLSECWHPPNLKA